MHVTDKPVKADTIHPNPHANEWSSAMFCGETRVSAGSRKPAGRRHRASQPVTATSRSRYGMRPSTVVLLENDKNPNKLLTMTNSLQ